MLENNQVLTDGITSPRAAVAYFVANHSLQLEGDVLDDVGAIGASLEASDESARLANAAAMISEARHRLHQRLRESWNVGGRDVLVSANGEVHSGYRQSRPVIRSTC